MDETILIEKYENLIYKIAHKFYNLELSDLYQAGCIGLIKASRKFDKSAGTNFIDFAYKYIFGEMYDLSNKSRDIKLNKAYLSMYKKITIAKKELTNILNKEPSTPELCEYLNIEENLLSEVINLSNQMMSLDDEYNTINGSLPIKECIGHEDNMDNQILINESLKHLEPLEQDVIRIRYFEDLTQMETAKVLGLSQVKVSRLEQKGKEKIREYIAT